jgi:hypothetical protein
MPLQSVATLLPCEDYKIQQNLSRLSLSVSISTPKRRACPSVVVINQLPPLVIVAEGHSEMALLCETSYGFLYYRSGTSVLQTQGYCREKPEKMNLK